MYTVLLYIALPRKVHRPRTIAPRPSRCRSLRISDRDQRRRRRRRERVPLSASASLPSVWLCDDERGTARIVSAPRRYRQIVIPRRDDDREPATFRIAIARPVLPPFPSSRLPAGRPLLLVSPSRAGRRRVFLRLLFFFLPSSRAVLFARSATRYAEIRRSSVLAHHWNSLSLSLSRAKLLHASRSAYRAQGRGLAPSLAGWLAGSFARLALAR